MWSGLVAPAQSNGPASSNRQARGVRTRRMDARDEDRARLWARLGELTRALERLRERAERAEVEAVRQMAHRSAIRAAVDRTPNRGSPVARKRS